MNKKILKRIILTLMPIMVFCIGVNNASADSYKIEYKYIKNLSQSDLYYLVNQLRGSSSTGSSMDVQSYIDGMKSGTLDSFPVEGDIAKYDAKMCTSTKKCSDYLRDDYCSCYKTRNSSRNNCGELSTEYTALCAFYVDGKQNSEYSPTNNKKSCSYSFQSINNIQVEDNVISDWDIGDKKYVFFINVTSNDKVEYFVDSDGDGNADVGLTIADSCFKTSDGEHQVCFMNGNKGQSSFENEFKNADGCPEIALALVDKTAGTYEWEAIIGTDVDINNWGYQITNTGTRNSITDTGEFNIIDRNEVNGFYYDPQTFNSCEDLLGPTLTAKLQYYLNIIRILIPIVLIALGMLDFSKAVLAQDENKMKESQKKFIRRLLIAVAIFFVPTLLNIIINIINAAWGNVVSTSCTL